MVSYAFQGYVHCKQKAWPSSLNDRNGDKLWLYRPSDTDFTLSYSKGCSVISIVPSPYIPCRMSADE